MCLHVPNLMRSIWGISRNLNALATCSQITNWLTQLKYRNQMKYSYYEIGIAINNSNFLLSFYWFENEIKKSDPFFFSKKGLPAPPPPKSPNSSLAAITDLSKWGSSSGGTYLSNQRGSLRPNLVVQNACLSRSGRRKFTRIYQTTIKIKIA